MSSFQGEVGLSIVDGVAQITFSHPKANCFSRTQLEKLSDVISNAGLNSNVKIILLKSSGDRAFSAGASFDEFKKIKSVPEAKEFFMGFAKVILAMRNASKPIICRVHGKAVGGGVGIIAASDYVIACQAAHIRLSELELGLGPFTIGLALERKIGAAHFSNITLDSEWRDANWAKACGLYSRVAKDIIELDSIVEELLKKLSALSAAALAANKKLLWQGSDCWEKELDKRAQEVAELLLDNK
jgi:methylglutaconyl-CoA hydratase